MLEKPLLDTADRFRANSGLRPQDDSDFALRSTRVRRIAVALYDAFIFREDDDRHYRDPDHWDDFL